MRSSWAGCTWRSDRSSRNTEIRFVGGVCFTVGPQENHVEEVIPRGQTGSEIAGEVTLIDAVEEDITVRAIPPSATDATPLELMP
jgi:hypothetical protein